MPSPTVALQKNPFMTPILFTPPPYAIIMDLDHIEDDLIDDAIFQAVIEAVQTQMVDKPDMMINQASNNAQITA